MNLGLQLSFTDISLDEAYVFSFINEFLRFKPHAFCYGTMTKPWNKSRFFSKINNFRSVGGITAYDLDNQILSIGKTGTNNPHLSLMVEQDMAVFLPDHSCIWQLINNEGFVCAYVYDSDYEEIQSTKFSGNYNPTSFAPEKLNTIASTPFTYTPGGTKEYDITHNPGRLTLIGYTWLMAAWKMWFGNEFYKLVPKEKILSFPFAERIEELPNNIVFVQLFREVDESHLPQNMQLQQKWRDWLEFDQLEKKYR